MKIIKFIKNSLIPNLHNAFHPYVLRAPALAFVVASLLLVQVVINIQQQTGSVLGRADSIEGAELVALTNQARTQAGVGTLSPNPRLQAAAETKAADMLSRNYWAHYTPDGVPPWSFIVDQGYEYRYAGENLAKDFRNGEGVLQGWLRSPAHRDNLLDSRFDEVGIAAVSGELNGKSTIVVVALYASQQPVQLRVGEAVHTGGEVLPTTTSRPLLSPVTAFATIPINTQVGVLILTALAMAYSLQHLVIRKRQLSWDKHAHPRPLLQASVLLGVAAILLQSGLGVVG